MNSTTEAYAARQRYEEFTLSADRGELTSASVWHSSLEENAAIGISL
jgi:hypothetical protein